MLQQGDAAGIEIFSDGAGSAFRYLETVRTPPTLLARLFLLVALALVPAVLQIYGTQVQLREQRTQAARDQALRLARDASARLGRFVEGLREALVVLAEAPPIRSGDPVACTAMMVQLRDRFAHQVLLGAVDPDGWLLCTTLGTPPRTIYDGDRSFFRLAMERGEVVVSEWEPAAVLLRGGSVHFGLPIRDVPGQPPLGVVGAAVGVDWLADLLRPIGLPAGATLTVVDREARIMIHLADTPSLTLQPGSPAPRELLDLLPPFSIRSSQQEPDTAGSVVDGPGWDGSPRIYGAAPFVPGTGGALRLVVSLDAAQALAPARAAARFGILMMLGGTVVALGAARLGGRRFVLQPLEVLLGAADKWEKGQYDARAAPALRGSIPELARLAGALDRVAEAADGRDRATAALRENEARLSLALEAGGLAAWELDRATGSIQRSARHDQLFGYAMPVAHWSWLTFLRHVLPEDRAMVTAMFRAQRLGRNALTLEFRIRRAGDDDIRWLEARGALHEGPDGAGKVLGVLVDVTERRRTEARLRLTVGELNHRVKNTLAAVQSISAQTLRGPDGPDAAIPAAARLAFQARLLALARSHEVLTREGWSGADLGELVALALAPHEVAPGARRCVVDGPPLRVPPRLAVPLAVALHELATNAARHGALSVPEGRVTVRWRLEPGPQAAPATLRLCWAESGGPSVQAPLRRGFGTRLLEGGLGRELGGSVQLTFRPEGVVCDIAAPLQPQLCATEAA
jgi:two-component sensor histidine kinase/PAS domain-containing protein